MGCPRRHRRSTSRVASVTVADLEQRQSIARTFCGKPLDRRDGIATMQVMTKARRLLSPIEVALDLGISESLVRRWCAEGRCGTKVGKQWVLDAGELISLRRVRRQTALRVPGGARGRPS